MMIQGVCVVRRVRKSSLTLYPSSDMINIRGGKNGKWEMSSLRSRVCFASISGENVLFGKMSEEGSFKEGD